MITGREAQARCWRELPGPRFARSHHDAWIRGSVHQDQLYMRTARLLIRPFELADAPALAPILAEPSVLRYLPEEGMAAEETHELLGRLVASYAELGRAADGAAAPIRKLTAAVTRAEDEALIGWVGLGQLEFEPDTIELYYGYAPAYWGAGYATEAGAAMLELGFDVVGLERIVGIVHGENRASLRVLRKLGMTFRDHLGPMAPEHAFFAGLPRFDLDRATFAASRPAGVTVRRMPADQLARLAEIDRSEHVTRTYTAAGGVLRERRVDWRVPPWDPDPESPHSAQALVHQFAPLLEEGGVLLGAFDAARIVGLGVLRPKLTEEMAQLALLHVSCSHRRQGVGTRLTEEILRLARWRGARRIYVSATPSLSAVGFYRRCGFVPTAEPHPELWALEPEDIHMVRPL
ncbi:MAG: GNAT family N-acetyltransferase [Candidatus Eisenbacteria bacterium]|nr:GNAT family N-acetyltransferase [Candidatus Eisenbacteria bacterium]